MKGIYSILAILVVFCIISAGCSSKSLFKEKPENSLPKNTTNTTSSSSLSLPNPTPLPVSQITQTVSQNDISDEYIELGLFIAQTLSNISPIYQEVRDSYAIEDYEGLSKAALKLQRFTENIRDSYFTEEKDPYLEKFGKLTEKEQIIMNKFYGYLSKLYKFSTSLQTPLSYIKEDPSKYSEWDEVFAFKEPLSFKGEADRALGQVFDSCSEYEIDCNHGLFKEKDLKR